MKPKYKRSREEENESNDQDENDEIQPCTKIRVESGPQDPPKLSVAKLYGSIHKLLVYLQSSSHPLQKIHLFLAAVQALS